MMEFFDQYYLLTRMLACFLIGFWWCSCGSLLQWSTQNPLACPVTIGLTALPVTLWMATILLGFNIDSWHVLLILLLLAILLHVVLWFKKAKTKANFDFFVRPQMIILGIGLNLTLASLFSFMHFYYSAKGQAFPSELWFGFLKNMDGVRFVIILSGTLFFIFGLNQIIKDLSKLSLGLVLARNICKPVELEKKLLIYVSILMCFLVFSGGIFSFWGLVLPHFLRKFNFFRRSLSREIWLGGICSGLLMMLLDFCCYNFPIVGSELPVGLLSSILGPILLVTILFKKSSQ